MRDERQRDDLAVDDGGAARDAVDLGLEVFRESRRDIRSDGHQPACVQA
ncbi:hypothetical protein [Microbacterium hominis]|nr:hypothetical protein [Microbacterium hominis]